MKREGGGLDETSHGSFEELPFSHAALAGSAVALRHLDFKATEVVSGRKTAQYHIWGECGGWYGVVEFPKSGNTHKAIG